MRPITALMIGASVLLSFSCAQPQFPNDDAAGDERMRQAADRYTACVTSEVEKESGNPIGAEDIAVAAHGRCWTAWDAYRQAAAVTYTANAQTREEKQLAHDRIDAHLRQFERDARRSLMGQLVQRPTTPAK